MNNQRFRQMNVGDLFDEAFDLYKQNFLLFLSVAAWTVVPAQAILAGIQMHFLHNVVDMAATFSGPGGIPADPTKIFDWLGELGAGLAVLLPVTLVAYSIGFASLVQVTSTRYLDEPITVPQVYLRVLKRFVPLFITSSVLGVIYLLGWFMCAIPDLIFTTILAFTIHAFVIERKSYFKALGRSNGLVSGEGFRIFGCMLLLGTLFYVLGIGLQMPFNYALTTLMKLIPGASSLFDGSSSIAGLSRQGQIINQVSEGFSSLIVSPFVVSVLTVLYYDLRVRKEAYDIERLAVDLNYKPLSDMPGYLPPATILGPTFVQRGRPPQPPGGPKR